MPLRGSTRPRFAPNEGWFVVRSLLGKARGFLEFTVLQRTVFGEVAAGTGAPLPVRFARTAHHPLQTSDSPGLWKHIPPAILPCTHAPLPFARLVSALPGLPVCRRPLAPDPAWRGYPVRRRAVPGPFRAASGGIPRPGDHRPIPTRRAGCTGLDSGRRTPPVTPLRQWLSSNGQGAVDGYSIWPRCCHRTLPAPVRPLDSLRRSSPSPWPGGQTLEVSSTDPQDGLTYSGSANDHLRRWRRWHRPSHFAPH